MLGQETRLQGELLDGRQICVAGLVTARRRLERRQPEHDDDEEEGRTEPVSWAA